MDRIDPSYYITDVDPEAEAILDVSNWYENQYSTKKIAVDADGNEADDNIIGWMLAQGWIIYATTHDRSGATITTNNYYLYRKVLKPESALRDLVESFTNAYNDGRTLNDQRYDEIVAIFTAVVDRTQTALIALEAEDDTYDGLVETLLTNISTDFTTHNTDVSGALDDWADSERTRIEDQFDNELTVQRSNLISRGAYNTTVWNSVSAGIERERAKANTDLEDKILERQLAEKNRLYGLKAEMRSKILTARDRLRTMLQNQEVERYGLRNTILQALCAFMERREDGYPDMAAVAKLTASLGASQPTYPAP
jgi:hypothetical protein